MSSILIFTVAWYAAFWWITGNYNINEWTWVQKFLYVVAGAVLHAINEFFKK